MNKQPDQVTRPTKFVVYPVGTAGTTRRGGKSVKCWNVRGHADGAQWFRRFTAPEATAEMAKRYARDLVADFESGLLWDSAAKRFVEPVAERCSSVWDWTSKYWGLQVSMWEPASRAWASRSLTRAVLGLLTAKAPTAPKFVHDALAATFSPNPTPASAEALAWLDTYSMPINMVSHDHIENLLSAHRAKNNGEPVAPATEKRFASDLQACWRAALGRGLIATNPWEAVKVARKTKRKGRVEKGVAGVQPVDPDVVLSPTQVLKLAEVVATTTPTAGRYRAFVATMGLCGPRPSEACALTIGDVELPPEQSSLDTGKPPASGWLTIRRTQRVVGSRWITDDEDPNYGPLKGRDSDEDRRVPIPSSLVPVLRKHIAAYRAEAGADDLLFTAVKGGPISLTRFGRDHWNRARAIMFAGNSTLANLHRHDLRHAACSTWLNAGVPLKVCTRWSGHQSVKVFLDIYQGILPGSEDEAIKQLESWLGDH